MTRGPEDAGPIDVHLADGGHVIVAFADGTGRDVADADGIVDALVRADGSEGELERAIVEEATAIGLSASCDGMRHPTTILIEGHASTRS